MSLDGRFLAALAILALASCGAPIEQNMTANEVAAALVAKKLVELTPDGRPFVPASTIWSGFSNGKLFCYDPMTAQGSCDSIVYAEFVSGNSAVSNSFTKWNAVQKHVVRDRTTIKGNYICSTTDDWSVKHSNIYMSSDDMAKIQGADVSFDPDTVNRWRADLSERWSGFMDREFCYRFALRRDAQGKTHIGELELFKYADGQLQPSEKPVYVNTYLRADLTALRLRSQN